MTDEVTTQNQSKKDDKKSAPNTSSNNNRGSKKNTAGGGAGGASGQGGAPRPSSRSGIKKQSSNPPAASAESGSDTNKKGAEGKKSEQRKNQGGGARGNNTHRKGQPSRQGTNTPKEQSAKSASPAPGPSADNSEALSSLQRVIADLKTTSPPNQPSPLANTLAASMHAPQAQSSNLTPNAPVFQPGGANLHQGMSPADAARHRKAVSLGASGLSGNFNSFSPHLGAMMEDAEDAGGNISYEDGEIQETYYQQQGHQLRAQSQSFMAPRFAALAAQQEQGDSMGPSGRPQLAPGFMFGARRRGASGPMAPPINEDDLSFQFPQQQQHFVDPSLNNGHRKADSSEIGGIMAEQVRESMFVLNTTFPNSNSFRLDRSSEPD